MVKGVIKISTKNLTISNKPKKELVIYQAKNGAIEFRGDFDNEENVIWANLNQIAGLFGRDKSVVSRHLKNIFFSGELEKSVVVAKIATTTKHGAIKGKTQTKLVDYYNLDVILSVGYRVDSKVATEFRKWATKIIKQHLINGYTINKKRIGQNYEKFMRAVADVKVLLPAGNKVKAEDILELINAFAGTWFSLDAYDKDTFPESGVSKKKVTFTAEEVARAKDKYDLIRYDSSGAVSSSMFPEDWLSLVIKMATGSGKTKVMSLLIAWSYFHKMYEADSELARNKFWLISFLCG